MNGGNPMKESRKSLISVFVPYYNDSAFLKECVESILNQSYETFELILLDHASTDNSAEIANSYVDQRIKHISLSKNLGAGGGALLYEFLKVAKGEYLKLFCADDVMHPDCLATFIEYMKLNPHIDVVFGNIQYIDEHTKKINADWFSNRRYFNINDQNDDILHKFGQCKSFLPYIGSFIKKDAFLNITLNRTYIMVFDMSIWVEMLLNEQNFAFLDKIVAFYRIHNNQVSSAKNSEKVSTASFYESIAYSDIFYSRAQNLKILKKICIDSPYLNNLEECDKDLMEFVMAHYFLNGGHKSAQINAYYRLEKMFSNECLRKKIELKFSYGIAEFRKDYTGIQSVSFKKRIYKKMPENLNFGDIMFLLLRNIWDIISLKNIRKKKRYTV